MNKQTSHALYNLRRDCTLRPGVPEPNDDLWAEYREGVRIGDVGVLRVDSGFILPFNVRHCSATDTANRNGDPNDFRPLIRNTSESQHTIPDYFPPDDLVLGTDAEKRSIDTRITDSPIYEGGTSVNADQDFHVDAGSHFVSSSLPAQKKEEKQCDSEIVSFRYYSQRYCWPTREPRKLFTPPGLKTDVSRAWRCLKETTVAQLFRGLAEFFYTLYLFTRSDWKTTMFPVSMFAIVAGPISSSERYLTLLLWIWTTLLQFNCANQAYSGDEDNINKPWRPIPAGRITPESTMKLRWTMIAINIAFSYYMGSNVLHTILFLTFAGYLYHEMEFNRHPVLRNICNAMGYAASETGATLIASSHLSLDMVAIRALTMSFLLILTTIHAQDFADCEGDRLTGRKTLPILFPESSRVYIAVVLVCWSVALAWFWELGLVCSAIFIAVGAFTAWQFYTKRDVESDERTYLTYNVWLMAALMLPINQRCKILSF